MRIKKMAKNLFFGFITQFVNIFVSMVIPPLIILKYGSQINGLISSIKQLMNYITLVGGGIATAATQSLYQPMTVNDKKKINGILNATDKLFIKAGAVFSILAVALAFLYPLLLNTEIRYVTIVKLVIVVSIAGASEFFWVGKLNVLLTADQRAYVSSIIQASGLLLSLICTVLMIKYNADIVLVQLTASLIYFVRIIVLTVYVKRKYTYLNSKEPASLDGVSKRNSALIHQLVGLPVLQSQTVILSFFVSLNAASIYSVYNLIFNGIYFLSFQISNIVSPFLGRTIVHGVKEQIRYEFNQLEFVVSITNSFIYSVAAVMTIPFIKIYIGQGADVNYVNHTVAMLFVCFGFINTCRLPALCAINSAGHFKETQYRAITEATLCILFQLLFVKPFGINGVLIASIIALSYRSLDMIIYANKIIIKQQNRKSIFHLIKNILTIISVKICCDALLPVNINGYFQWILWSCIVSGIAITFILAINLVFDHKMLKQTSQLFKSMFRN